VHGKNHHVRGSFGQHLEWIDLRLPNGESRRLTRADDSPLWRATLGGLGLTGMIERVALRLERVPSNALVVRKRRIRDLDEFLAEFQASSQAEYVVGWIDALARGPHLGRGILETAARAERSLDSDAAGSRRVPFDLPSFALGRTTVRAFNAVYRRHVPADGAESTMPYAKFLFPLDAIHEWNRIYGRRGFHQFQCLVPFEGGRSRTAANAREHRAVGPRLVPGGAEGDGRARNRLSVVPRSRATHSRWTSRMRPA
jgi:decaprenylphospho-beta-D-ribofuranose 2-oxidase